MVSAPEHDQIFKYIDQILVSYKALEATRARIRSLWLTKAADNPRLHQLIISLMSSSEEIISGFLLDLSVHPETIHSHSPNKEQLKRLERWNIRC